MILENINKFIYDNKMLRFKQFLALLEGLNPAQEASVSSWVPDEDKVHAPEGFASKAATHLSYHVIPKGQQHIIIPAVSGVMGAVHNHLTSNGYRIKDYVAGIAEKLPSQKQIERAKLIGKGEAKPQETTIGRALKQSKADEDLMADYESDDRKRAVDFNKNFHILISREANAVAGCSTDKPWESCATMDEYGGTDGAAASRLPDEIREGTHVAYQIPKEFAHLSHDQQIDHAVSRVLLKPFTSEEGHTILRPEDKTYSKWDKKAQLAKDIQAYRYKNVSLLSALENFTNEHFPMRDVLYKKNPNVYNDDNKSIRINYENHPYREERKALIKKLKKGNFDINDIKEAQDKQYFDDGIVDASRVGFFRNLNAHKFNYDQAKFHVNHNDSTFHSLLETDGNKETARKMLAEKIKNGDITHDWHNFFTLKGLISDDLNEQIKQKVLDETRKGRFKGDYAKIFPELTELHPYAKQDLLNELNSGHFDHKTMAYLVASTQGFDKAADKPDVFFNEEIGKAAQKALTSKLKYILSLKNDKDNEFLDDDGNDVTRNFVAHAHANGYLTGEANELSKRLLIRNLKNDKIIYSHLRAHINDTDVQKQVNDIIVDQHEKGYGSSELVNHAFDNGFLGKNAKDAMKKNHMKIMETAGKPLSWSIESAKDYGFYDNDYHNFCKNLFLKSVEEEKAGKHDIKLAKDHGYYDPDEVQYAEDLASLKKIEAGQYGHYKTTWMQKLASTNPVVREAYRKGLMANLGNDDFRIDQLNHAIEHGFFDQPAKEGAAKSLSKYIEEHREEKGGVSIINGVQFNNTSERKDHYLNHAIAHGYFSNEVKKADENDLLHKAKNGSWITSIEGFSRAARHGYLTKEIKDITKKTLLKHFDEGDKWNHVEQYNLESQRKPGGLKHGLYLAARYGFLDDDIKQKSLEWLKKHENDPKFKKEYDEHKKFAVDNNYFNSYPPEQQREKDKVLGFLNNRDEPFNTSHIDHAIRHGVFDENVREAAGRSLRDALYASLYKGIGDVDSNMLEHAIEHGYFDNGHDGGVKGLFMTNMHHSFSPHIYRDIIANERRLKRLNDYKDFAIKHGLFTDSLSRREEEAKWYAR